MNILTKVQITGFWGNRRLSTRFNNDINFFIGVNGTGKTTAINMIAAALNADFATLDRLEFKKISIELKVFKGKGTTSIEITKQPRKRFPFPEINYQITDNTTGESTKYSLDSLEEQLSFRQYALHPYKYRRGVNPDILEHMKRLVNVSWLSIHRAESLRTSKEATSFESTVDKKLDDLSGDFLRYFSKLQGQGTNETAKFQQEAFLSLIRQQTVDVLLSSIRIMDLKEERKALVDIFHMFRLGEQTFSDDLDKHFIAVDKSLTVLRKKGPLKFVHAISLVSMLRAHLVVQEWAKLTRAHERIFEPRTTFIRTINDLLIDKYITVNERNEFVAVSKSKKIFTLKQLSSGEKQLLIILGESLLQEKAPWIYIADEPELSLHVSWQSQLIDSLRKVNPNAQIIFATHSPDIVSQHEKKTIAMNRIIK